MATPSTASDPPGHPALGRTEVAAGLVARRSMLFSGLTHAYPHLQHTATTLAAHSCGGSTAIATIPLGVATHRFPS
jgi:hypothetical protein